MNTKIGPDQNWSCTIYLNILIGLFSDTLSRTRTIVEFKFMNVLTHLKNSVTPLRFVFCLHFSNTKSKLSFRAFMNRELLTH